MGFSFNKKFRHPKSTVFRGWREIGSRNIFFRSRWEYNYAVYLEYLLTQKQIQGWEHEPGEFWFEKIRRGVRSYKPDFKIRFNDGKIEYHEVKGWMDSRSKTALKRMRIYHPEITMRVIDSKWFKSNGPKLCWLPGWESGAKK
jgi:hypothetical protein